MEERVHLREALAELSDDMREIILLRDAHGLSYAEIASTLDIATGTVMSRLSRARSTLRDLILAKERPDEHV